jgi:hypothetical protein
MDSSSNIDQSLYHGVSRTQILTFYFLLPSFHQFLVLKTQHLDLHIPI